jgi:hypothetical protein
MLAIKEWLEVDEVAINGAIVASVREARLHVHVQIHGRGDHWIQAVDDVLDVPVVLHLLEEVLELLNHWRDGASRRSKCSLWPSTPAVFK